MRKSSVTALFFCASYPTPAKVFGALAAVALLVGADNALADRSPSQADACDYQGPSGLCVRADRHAKRFALSALEAAYLEAKRELEARYRLDLSDVPGPVVHVVGFADFARAYSTRMRLDGDARGDFGWTSFGSGEITLTGPLVMRHEAYHYFLWKTGYSNRLNAAHDHGVFDEYRERKRLPERTAPPSPTAATQEAHAEPAKLSTSP